MDVYNLGGGRGDSFIGPKQTGVWAEQGMVFRALSLKQGIQFHYLHLQQGV